MADKSDTVNVGEVVGKAIGVAIVLAIVYTLWVGALALLGGLIVWWLLPIALPVVTIGYWQSVLLVIVVNLILLPLKTKFTGKVEKNG